MKVKSLLLSHLSAEWRRLWIEGQLKPFQCNFIDFVELVNQIVSFLSAGDQLPPCVSVTLGMCVDLNRMIHALDASAPWTQLMNIVHPRVARSYSHPATLQDCTCCSPWELQFS